MVKKAHSNTLLDIRMMMSLAIMYKASLMIGYVKCFDSNKTMSFKVNDKNQFKKYNKIWKKKLMDIEFDKGPVYGDNDKT